MSLPNYDNRIEKILTSFKNMGWISLDIGFLYPSMDWDPYLHKHVWCNAGKHSQLIIQDSAIFNPEEMSKINEILDEAEIVMSLPEFYGEESMYYTLDSKSNHWINLGDIYSEGVFYIMFKRL